MTSRSDISPTDFILVPGSARTPENITQGCEFGSGKTGGLSEGRRPVHPPGVVAFPLEPRGSFCLLETRSVLDGSEGETGVDGYAESKSPALRVARVRGGKPIACGGNGSLDLIPYADSESPSPDAFN